MKSKSIQAVQMIGTQRSGSNLLRVMLNQHPQITAPHPPHILKRFMPLQASYGDLQNTNNFKLLVDDICRLVEYNPVPWDDEKIDREEVSERCNTRSIISIFKAIYDLRAEKTKASHWVCKSMANVHYAMEIEKELSPLYIHLVRDGRDVALSFKNAIVGEKHIYHLAQQWKKDQIACEKLHEIIDPKRIIQIKYEDLIRDTENVLRSLLHFLNLEFDAAVFKYFDSKESLNTAKAGKMWSNVCRPVISNNTRKFETGLSQHEIQIFENIAGSNLDKLDYQRCFPYNDKAFNPVLIEHFSSINANLKKIAKKQTDPNDLKKRVKQSLLLDEIKMRI